MKVPARIAVKIADFSLRKAKCALLNLPDDLKALDTTVLLVPNEPDEVAREILNNIESVLGEKLKSIAGFGPMAFDNKINYIDLGSSGPFGYPRRSASDKLTGFGTAIDLSEEFQLPLSALPARANIHIRVGRDEQRAGDAYNIIAKNWNSLNAILYAGREDGRK